MPLPLRWASTARGPRCGVRLLRDPVCPKLRQAEQSQKGTGASREHGRKEPQALTIRGLASARRKDASYTDDGSAIDRNKGRMGRHDTKYPPEHHFQAPSSPLGVSSE